jgi:hypothetical protein
VGLLLRREQGRAGRGRDGALDASRGTWPRAKSPQVHSSTGRSAQGACPRNALCWPVLSHPVSTPAVDPAASGRSAWGLSPHPHQRARDSWIVQSLHPLPSPDTN